MSDQEAYTQAGVSQRHADAAVEALVGHLAKIDPGRPSRVVPRASCRFPATTRA
jgi:hypothetical protein